MGSASDQATLTESFNLQCAAFEVEQERLRVLFCESRYELLVQAYEASGSTLDLSGFLLKDWRRYNDDHPWQRLVESTYQEQRLWELLFSNVLGARNARTGFVEYFNRLLKAKEVQGVFLADIVTKMFFNNRP